MSSAGNAFAFPVVAAAQVVVVVDHGSNRGNGGNGGSDGGNGSSGTGGAFDVHIGFSGDLFVHVGDGLGPGFSILVVGGNGNGGSVDDGGNGGDGGNVVDGCNGDGVSLGSCVPGGGELLLGGLYLGGISDVELGEGVSGHSQGSENNL